MTTATESAPTARGGLKQALDYFLWAYTPLRRLSASGIYDLVSTNAFTARGLYLNLGYWKSAQTIDEACEAMATLVGQTALLGPNDDVVDVGFGFADQDMLWVDRFAPRRIVGLNVTASQVRIARERVRKRGMADRIDLRQGSATDMPLPDASCDVVTAVECAFHFHSRERFFQEAFRVLRPGGRLVVADVIRAEPAQGQLRIRLQDFVWAQFVRLFAIPADNADRREDYAGKLAAAGFADVRVSPITEHVFPGWHRALAEDGDLLRRIHPAGRLPYRLLLGLDASTVYGAFEYVLAEARKPL